METVQRAVHSQCFQPVGQIVRDRVQVVTGAVNIAIQTDAQFVTTVAAADGFEIE